MKGIFRRLVCYSFLSIASIGSFEVEARLPRYQGEAAVKQLVKKVWEDRLPFVNKDYTKNQFINDIINIIYTNEGRQSLAKWMYERRPESQGKDYVYGRNKKVFDDVAQDTSLYRLLSNFLRSTSDTIAFNQHFSMLMNLAFPCWTGTLTCYMHNDGQSLAKESLKIGALGGIGDIVVAACKWLLLQQDKLPLQLQNKLKRNKINTTKTIFTNNANLAKLIGILFTLEVIDDWNQLTAIVGNTDLNAPTVPAGYQSDLIVPVPNTGYNSSSGKYESDCHISTLKNLLAVLCNYNYNAIKHENTARYFTSRSIAEVIMGETSKQNHTAWFNSLPESIKNSAEPSMYWLIYALKVLLANYDKDFSTFQLELLKEHANDEIVDIQKTIRKITNNDSAEVEINPLQDTKGKPWRDHRMKITLPERHITIQIDGTLTRGSHIEITDLSNTQ